MRKEELSPETMELTPEKIITPVKQTSEISNFLSNTQSKASEDKS